MECPIQAALIGLVGVLAGGLIGHRFAIGREDRARRVNFNSRMCELKSLADKTEDANFATWVAETQVAIERECGLVQNSVCCYRQKKLTTLRGKISKIQRPDIEDYDNNKLSFPRAVMTYQKGRILVAELLQNLIDCAG